MLAACLLFGALVICLIVLLIQRDELVSKTWGMTRASLMSSSTSITFSLPTSPVTESIVENRRSYNAIYTHENDDEVPHTTNFSLSEKYDFSGYDLDSEAVPSLMIVGVAKGGTTDMWNVLTNIHPGFMARYNSRNYMLDKEVNIGFVSESFLQKSLVAPFPCAEEQIQNMLKCPQIMIRNNDFSRNMTRCMEWLNGSIGKVAIPRYTVDSFPYMMRESRTRMPNVIFLNMGHSNTSNRVRRVWGGHENIKQNGDKGGNKGDKKTAEVIPTSTTQCQVTRKRLPKILTLLRDPFNRTISYFNYFITRRQSFSLEQMISMELDFLDSPTQRSLLHDLKLSMSTPEKITRENAYKAMEIYDVLNENMKNMLEAAKKKNPEANFDTVSILLDSVYLPQILGLLYPRNADGISLDSFAQWPILVLQSEHFFKDRLSTFHSAIMPFLHPNQSTRPSLLSNAASILQNVNINSNEGRYSPLSNLTPKTSQRIVIFFGDFNRLLVMVLYYLQESGRIFVTPTLKADNDKWWNRRK